MTWYAFLVPLGLLFFAASGLAKREPTRVALIVLACVCFAIAALLALPVLHLA